MRVTKQHFTNTPRSPQSRCCPRLATVEARSDLAVSAKCHFVQGITRLTSRKLFDWGKTTPWRHWAGSVDSASSSRCLHSSSAWRTSSCCGWPPPSPRWSRCRGSRSRRQRVCSSCSASSSSCSPSCSPSGRCVKTMRLYPKWEVERKMHNSSGLLASVVTFRLSHHLQSWPN